MLEAWGAAEEDPSIVVHRTRLAEPRLRARTGFDAEGEALQAQRVAADIKRVLESKHVDEPTKHKLIAFIERAVIMDAAFAYTPILAYEVCTPHSPRAGAALPTRLAPHATHNCAPSHRARRARSAR